MNKTLTDQLFCFSEDEFSVLADVCGLRIMYGFDMKAPNPCESSESRYNRSIVALYKKGVLVPEKDGLSIDVKVRKVFECIRSAEYVLKLIYSDSGEAPVCIYPGDGKTAYMRPSADGVNYVSTGLKYGEPLKRFLEKSDYLPKAEVSAEIISLREKIGDTADIPQEAFDRLPGNVFYGVLVENATRQVMRKAAVVQKGIEEILVIDAADGSRTAELYTRERFIDSICI